MAYVEFIKCSETDDYIGLCTFILYAFEESRKFRQNDEGPKGDEQGTDASREKGPSFTFVWICSGQNGKRRHADDGECRAGCPSFEFYTGEPISLARALKKRTDMLA